MQVSRTRGPVVGAAIEYALLTEAELQLPRQLIASYSWLDTDASLRIVCTLLDSIEKVCIFFLLQNDVKFCLSDSSFTDTMCG